MRQFFVYGPGGKLELIDKNGVVFGREKVLGGAVVPLPPVLSMAISHKHLGMLTIRGHIMIQDMNAAGGVYLNGNRLAPGDMRLIDEPLTAELTLGPPEANINIQFVTIAEIRVDGQFFRRTKPEEQGDNVLVLVGVPDKRRWEVVLNAIPIKPPDHNETIVPGSWSINF